MIPLERLPGFRAWGPGLEAWLARPEALWVHGASGSGVSQLAAELARRRGSACLDPVERMPLEEVVAWLEAHPRGVCAARVPPEDPGYAEAGSRCIALRLASLDEDPSAVAGCLEAMAAEEGAALPLPPALTRLPCPGGLRGLRNRLLRWMLVGQLPEDPGPGGPAALPLEEDLLATNLHLLERLLLHRALRRAYGNRVEAARRLGVSRRQLYLLIARHGDPVRGEVPTKEGPKRLARARNRQNSSLGDPAR